MRRIAIRSILPTRAAALLLLAVMVSACGRSGIHVSTSPQPSAVAGAPTLLIRLDDGHDARFGERRQRADYLSDGTVIRYSNQGDPCDRGQPCGSLERNALTGTGLAALRALLDKNADLLARPWELTPQEAGRADVVNTVVLGQPDGTRVAITMPSNRSRNHANWDVERAGRLDALADALADTETLAGPGGLTSPTWQTYQPTTMAVFIQISALPPKPTPIRDQNGRTIGMPLDGLSHFKLTGPWPFDAPPGDFGMAFTGRNSSRGRCGFVDPAAVQALTAIVPPSAGGTLAARMLAMGTTWGSDGIEWDDSTVISFKIAALLPEDVTASCADAQAY